METALDLPSLSQERKKDSRLRDSNNDTMQHTNPDQNKSRETAMEQTEVTGTWADMINLTESLVTFLGMRRALH